MGKQYLVKLYSSIQLGIPASGPEYRPHILPVIAEPPFELLREYTPGDTRWFLANFKSLKEAYQACLDWANRICEVINTDEYFQGDKCPRNAKNFNGFAKWLTMLVDNSGDHSLNLEDGYWTKAEELGVSVHNSAWVLAGDNLTQTWYDYLGHVHIQIVPHEFGDNVVDIFKSTVLMHSPWESPGLKYNFQE